ncbi:REST corepressor 1,REST corepressor 2,REST corepressor 3,REST corepressor [Octopus vulgaris]|uniref:REST corepressor 1,REST corepressor 2,REST corepressor 3,REST corepressor n=2 Tax=Octopus TaxID=6643 RepID=A0AA36B8A2_OCTVU|nr:REST corepressor 3 isoform X1 [Octopus sinensis]CAI9729721.1 REST corepressor 1,REST corepressor 2,REST corepressor 3,REST corepressor [Octopus vulgaris]
MVLADKSSDDIRNGRRSRCGSPNGQISDDSSAADDSDHESGMRVGEEYQARIPDSCISDGKNDVRTDAMLVWAPNADLCESRIDDYVTIAKEKHGYNMEQALGMLFWHKHNIEKALADLPNFTPFPDEWTVEDKVLFEQAFSFHGKSFQRIRQMLPDKSIASLVKYYYSWKKTRSRTSLMDRQAKKLAGHPRDGDSDGASDEGSRNSDSDVENNKENGTSRGEDSKSCTNCGMHSSQLHSTAKGSLCNSCNQYLRRTGVMKSSTGPTKRREQQHSQHRHNPMRHKRKPPRGMYLNEDDLRLMLTGPLQQAEQILKSLDAELVSLKRQVQNNKQIISMQKHKTSSGIDEWRPPETTQRINSRWTNDELLLAVQGVRRYGKDFKAIAEVIGNKLEAHVRNFFINYRRRYNLDEVLAEYESEHGTDSVKEEEEEEEEKKDIEKMDVDGKSSTDGAAASSSPPPINQESVANLPASGSGNATPTAAGTPAPPPLLKQPQVPITKGNNSQASQHPRYRLLPQPKTILQQPPPPLIRPMSGKQPVSTVVPAQMPAAGGRD